MSVLPESIRESFEHWDADDLDVLADTAKAMAQEKAEQGEERIPLTAHPAG